MDEVREIYSEYKKPHCTRYNHNGESASEHKPHERQSIPSCEEYIYNFDFGYHSMVSEVCYVWDVLSSNLIRKNKEKNQYSNFI